MVRTIRYLVIGCWLVGLWTGTMIAQDSQYEFGVVPFFKNYPEFKRGFDPAHTTSAARCRKTSIDTAASSA